ncbi:MAG TPA: S-layer homology domain-containing protein, partial [Candidatus Flavonifractor merdigallinarum]|nr:S-layer homology domain-containing protein [Candidatus Flavonifractor merdigallinarum]
VQGSDNNYTATITLNGITVTVTDYSNETGTSSDYTQALNSAITTLNNDSGTYNVDAADKTRYEQVQAIHDYVCDTVSYTTSSDLTPRKFQTVYSALVEHVTVCAGYAKAFKVLCDEYKIPCVLVSGTGGTNGKQEDHMWNYVQMDDSKWYAVDCTWDDDDKTTTYHDFFLVGKDTPASNFGSNVTFGNSHTESGSWSSSSSQYQFTYPTLETNKYTPKENLTGSVSISGTAKIGEQLTASVSGSNASSFTYQWYRGSEAISGAISSTYTPATAEDVGKTITVKVTAEDYSGELTSSTTSTIAKGDGPAAPTNLTATSVTSDSITVTANDTWEYSKDNGGSWQASNVFSGLSPSTEYSIVARVKETTTHNASAPSAALTATTKAGPISAVTVSVTAPVTGTGMFVNATVTEPATGVNGEVTWYEGTSVTGTPATGTFKANTVYTAKITLTVTGDQPFANPTAVSMDGKVSNLTPGSDGSLVLTKTFPATANKTVTGITITKQPATLKYKNGDSFDPAGMEVTATYDDGSSAPVSGYTVSPDPLIVGTTNVTVTYAGKTAVVSGIIVLNIPTAENFSITLPQGAVYDGKEKTASVTVNATVAGMGNVTAIKYNGNTTPPVNAGSYTVTFDVAEGTGYAAATDLPAGSFTIAKADQAALTITSAGPATYGENYPLTTSGGSGDGAVTFAVTDGTGKATISGSNLVPVQVGDVTVTATKAGDNNYNSITSAEATITINKADYPNATTASGYVKAETAGYVILPALPDGASYGEVSFGDAATTAEYVTNLTLDGSKLSYTGGKSVVVGGTYTLKVVIHGGVNYNDSALTLKLTGTNLFTPSVTVEPISITYTGSALKNSDIKGTATYNGESVSGTWTWSSGANPPVNVADSGEHTVFFTPDDQKTYTTVTATVKVTISKATPTGAPKYTAITTSGKTLADAGLTVQGGTFSVPGTVAWELPGTTAVQSNTSYKWIFTPTDQGNYNTINGIVVLYTVTPSSGGGGGSSSSHDDDDDYTPSGNTTTERNPDGSTTTTVTKPNGTKTETTKHPDGSKEVVETAKDGTVTTTSTDKSGNETKTVENPNGSSKTTVTNRDGSGSTTTLSQNGQVTAEVTLPASVVEEAGSAAVTLPMPSVPVTTSRTGASTITVDLPTGSSAKVEIPVKNPTTGTVAILVKADGTEEVIKTSVTTRDGVSVTLSDGDTVKIVDNGKTFQDVPYTHWGSEAVNFATSRELFAGTSATTFGPETPMTRAMIVTVLARFEGVDTSTGATWYTAGRQWAMANGISDGTNMEQNLSREQLAAMLYRYAGSPAVTGSLSGYPDGASVSAYATDAMTWAVENGLIAGTGSGALDPQGEATRAQVAAILMRFVESMA